MARRRGAGRRNRSQLGRARGRAEPWRARRRSRSPPTTARRSRSNPGRWPIGRTGRSSTPPSPPSRARAVPSASRPGTPAAAPGVKVAETAQAIDIDTGKLQCRIPKQGPCIHRNDDHRRARSGARRPPGLHAGRPFDARRPALPRVHQRHQKGRSGTDRAGARRRQNRRRAQERRPRVAPLHRAPLLLRRHRGRAPGAHHRLRRRPQQDFIKGLGLAFAVPDARAGAQSPRALRGRGRRIVVGARTARHRAPPVAGRIVCGPARRKAHRQQGNLQRRRAKTALRLGRVGRFQTRPNYGRRLHHPEAHQSRELLAGRHRRTPRQRTGLRRRRVGRACGGREELLAVVPRVASKCATPPRPRPNCASGSGRPKRPRWTCATTTPGRTISIPATKTCSPASARRTAWRAPAR